MNNTIADKTCTLLSELMAGGTFDRRRVAELLGVNVAAADRYIRSVADVPGVIASRSGRRWLISFRFSESIKKARGL